MKNFQQTPKQSREVNQFKPIVMAKREYSNKNKRQKKIDARALALKQWQDMYDSMYTETAMQLC